MMYQNAAVHYKQNTVQWSSPQELTLMLYKGLVKFLKIASMEIDKNNYSAVNDNLIRSQNIIRELLITLDMRYEVAQNMAAMYEYMLERLVQANVKKDQEIIKEVIGYAEDFRDTWAEAMKLVK